MRQGGEGRRGLRRAAGCTRERNAAGGNKLPAASSKQSKSNKMDSPSPSATDDNSSTSEQTASTHATEKSQDAAEQPRIKNLSSVASTAWAWTKFLLVLMTTAASIAIGEFGIADEAFVVIVVGSLDLVVTHFGELLDYDSEYDVHQ